MKKALELLKADRDYCQSINNDKSIIEQYDEAIDKLENLEEKSCEGCISYITDINGFSFCETYENDFNFVCSRGYWLEDNYTKF